MNKLTNEQFKEKIKELVGDEYTFLDDYVNYNTHLKVRHNVCGNVYSITPNSFISTNSRCKVCSRKKVARKLSMTTEEFKEKVKAAVGDEYEVLGEYVTNKTKIKFLYKKCGNTFEMRPNDFQQRRRCPYCIKKEKSSRFSETFELVLKLKGVKYKKEVKFKNIKSSKGIKLTHDFLLTDYNLVVEIDGQQHFNFSTFQSHDWIRNLSFRQPKMKKYSLLRIDYKIKQPIITKIINSVINEDKEEFFKLVNKYKLLFVNSEVFMN